MPHHIGYATHDADTPLAPLAFDRQHLGAEDIRIDIHYCGVCHSDVHQARDEFGGALATNFPCMPGHEIVGLVSEVGDDVRRYAVGDRVGVGCMVYWGDESQRDVLDEQYQDPPATFTYNTPDPDTGEVTFGGYSDEIIVNEHFVLRIPDTLSLERAAPLLCAGVTTWAPLRRFDVGAGQVVGIAGIGGLGHIAIQLAKARGAARVLALTTTPDKREEALRLGADEVIVVGDQDAMSEHASSLDFVLTTIPTPFDMKPYISLLKFNGTFVSVGMLEPSLAGSIHFGEVAMKRITISASLIGDVAETQEVLDFCAEHEIAAEIKLIPADAINAAFDHMVDNEIQFRYVIDNATLEAARQ